MADERSSTEVVASAVGLFDDSTAGPGPRTGAILIGLATVVVLFVSPTAGPAAVAGQAVRWLDPADYRWGAVPPWLLPGLPVAVMVLALVAWSHWRRGVTRDVDPAQAEAVSPPQPER